MRDDEKEAQPKPGIQVHEVRVLFRKIPAQANPEDPEQPAVKGIAGRCAKTVNAMPATSTERQNQPISSGISMFIVP
jgi:hypothetical protein